MFYIKQNDTAPAIRATLYDSSNNAIDLTDTSVRFYMKHESGSLVANGSVDIIETSNGIVEYGWTTGDTSLEGVNYGEFEITYGDGTIETFPNGGYIKIKVTRELG